MNLTAIGIITIAFGIMAEIMFLRIIFILERIEAKIHQCWKKLNEESENQKD